MILRIDQHCERHFGFLRIARVFVDFQDGDLPGFKNLIGRQTDAIVFFHGFDHVVDEFLHTGRLKALQQK